MSKCTTFTTTHGPPLSGRFPENTPVKRVNTYVKYMRQQGLQFPSDSFRNTCSLHSQAPILTTLITGNGTVPTRSGTLYRIISQTGFSTFFSRSSPGYFNLGYKFFLYGKRIALGKIVGYSPNSELDYTTSQGEFFEHIPHWLFFATKSFSLGHTRPFLSHRLLL